MAQHAGLEAALTALGDIFARRSWPYLDVPADSPRARTYAWPGKRTENIMICVHKGPDIDEEFHRQDFFFFNFAYSGSYGALSYSKDNAISVHEDECYIGQPHTGYALKAHEPREIIIIGILIRKEPFFRTFLPALSSDDRLFRFFLEPQDNPLADDFLHVRFEDASAVRSLLELMVLEQASPGEDTQAVLQPLVLGVLMQVARAWRRQAGDGDDGSGLAARIVRHLGAMQGEASLAGVAAHFGYHPNYLSTLLRQKTGRSFSEIVLSLRMNRAAALLEHTRLPVEEIAFMVGYGSSGNFYRAFRTAFGRTPAAFRAAAAGDVAAGRSPARDTGPAGQS